MSDKVRIHDLAKRYGMSGKDLAAKLRDLGFAKAKSHMSALDQFEVLQVQGILEAHGLIASGGDDAAQDDGDLGGGLVLRRKKKRKAPSAPTAKTTKAPAPEAAAPPPTPSPTPAPEAEPAPAVAEEVATAPTPAPAPAPPEPVEATAPPAAPPPEPEPAVARAAAEPPAEVELVPQAAAKPAAPEARAKDEPAAKVDAPGAGEDVEAGDAGRSGPRGTVVGFIDPASFQHHDTPKRRPESRRLQSRDDAAPDVRPTFAHDRSKAMMRGAGGARGSLTAAQLREREQGRFLRRSRPGGPGGPGGRRGGGRSELVTESPLAGTKVQIDAPVTIGKLAEAMKLKANIVLRQALEGGYGALNINAVLDDDTAHLLSQEFDIELEVTHEVAAEEALLDELKKKRSEVGAERLEVRPPTVAFLGHVDHGKTTLIDSIRVTRVAEGEAGGITQHIGAYQVTTQRGHAVTIVDTPGHAAFTAMRARGASAVDIVVLVVAGDDGVKPHTEEALNHARAAKVPVIVAITKKDKAEYNAQRTMEQLARLELNPEEWGGQTAMIQVSALENDGVEELLERVFLEGELLELRAHPEGPASGVVLEAEKQQGKGIVAHLLVQDGTLNRGDVILAGEGYGKVRSIHDDRGQIVETAGPSQPVEVSGLDALPGVGEAFHVVESLARAKEVATERERNARAVAMAEKRTPSKSLEAILGPAAGPELKTINVIVRADVQGSVEVLRQALGELRHEEVEVKLIHSGVGAVTESDVDLAATSEARVLAFHVGIDGKARSAAERSSIEIRRYNVIYELLDDLRALMEGALSPEFEERVTGHAEIRRLFKSSKIGLIAGCMVLDGSIKRSARVRLLRDDQVVYTGSIGSLRRESDDAKEVREGFECGIVLRDYRDIKEGDVIEAYEMVEVKRSLEKLSS